MTEFMYDGAGKEKTLDHLGIGVLYPQSISCKTKENNQNKTDC